jgi:hypothetical protein
MLLMPKQIAAPETHLIARGRRAVAFAYWYYFGSSPPKRDFGDTVVR